MIKDFKFFQNNKVRVFTDYMDQMDDYFLGGILPPRYPRIPSTQIPYSESYETEEEKRAFKMGWRSCERGGEVFNNPYSNREELIYPLHRAWESGYVECYINHPTKLNNIINRSSEGLI